MSLQHWLVAALCVLCVKTLPLLWHLRFFWALSRRLSTQNRPIKHQLLRPSVMTTRSPPTECDFNMHKSNSTYFTDLDVSRAHLSGLLFAPMFRGATTYGRCNLMIGAVACTFRKEIKPQQTYELWTRVASWDEKWLYMVTHFVLPESSRRQQDDDPTSSTTTGNAKGTEELLREGRREPRDRVLASAVTRMVFKQGRLTVTPVQAFAACNDQTLGKAVEDKKDSQASVTQSTAYKASIEPDARVPVEGKLDLKALELVRDANLPIVQLHGGWDAVHALFDGVENNVLSRHQDIMF